MKNLLDNIIMSNAYCEITDCRDIENCEKCVELNIEEHDKQIRVEVIEEFINELELDIMRYEFSSIELALPRIKKIAEHLKEQK